MKGFARRVVGVLPTAVVYHIHHGFHQLTGVKGPVKQLGYIKDWPEPPVVVAGPFKGLVFTRETYSSSLVASLLGTYEMEIHGAVEWLIGYAPDVMADIGAGEGYYAVGMAVRSAGTTVLGYEMFKPANHILGCVAKANGVAARVKRPGICTVEKLEEGLRGAKKPAVICDCEGAEDFLLDPVKVGALKRAAILVELHDHFNAGVSGRVRERFSGTHDIREFETRGRTMGDLPAGYTMTQEELEEMVVEHRKVVQKFFLMVPRKG